MGRWWNPMSLTTEFANGKYRIQPNIWHHFLFGDLVIIYGQLVWDEETRRGGCHFSLSSPARGPLASSFRTHLLHYVGDNWWGEGWSQTHTSQPHNIAWGSHLFLWCDSALYRGCSHCNKWNINAVIINKQYLDTKMSTGVRFLLALFFTLAEGWQVYFNSCVRLDRVALGAGVTRSPRLHLDPIRISATRDWWCFFYSHEVGNGLVYATCLPPLLCGFH